MLMGDVLVGGYRAAVPLADLEILYASDGVPKHAASGSFTAIDVLPLRNRIPTLKGQSQRKP